ncbi:uncharacterized protein LOC144366913 [Ictidomys tridecemlineatus]
MYKTDSMMLPKFCLGVFFWGATSFENPGFATVSAAVGILAAKNFLKKIVNCHFQIYTRLPGPMVKVSGTNPRSGIPSSAATSSKRGSPDEHTKGYRSSERSTATTLKGEAVPSNETLSANLQLRNSPDCTQNRIFSSQDFTEGRKITL